MARNKSKSRKSGNGSSTTTQETYDTDEYGLEEEQLQKKKNAKSKKRELESQYGSAPLDSSMKSGRSGKNKKKSYEGEESFELLELVKQRPRVTKKPAHKKSKSKRNSSSKHEQSFAVDDLVVPPSRGRQPSGSRPSMQRGRSANRSTRSSSQNPRSLSRSASTKSKRSMSLDRSRSNSISGMTDHTGARRGIRPGLSSQGSYRPGLTPQGSLHGSRHMQLSRHGSMQLSRHGSRHQMSRAGSGLSVLYDGNGSAVIVAPGPMKRSQSQGRKGMRRFIPKKEDAEAPARSIVLIWVIVSAELGFDLGTTIIAFQSFLEEDSCCGNPIKLGSIPVGSTIPFFLLVVAELAFLIRAIVLTIWPSMLVGGDGDTEDLEDPGSNKRKRSTFSKYCCCILRIKVRILLQIINFLVLLNPFFGCIIAWMLMYQSDKTEAFIVLGLEAGSLVLHFISVWLEGSFSTCKERCIHCIPLIPFFISIGLVLYYLKQGGVCYLVEQRLFKFTGCEICNISGVIMPCPNGTSLFDGFELDNLDTFDKIKDKVLDRTEQGTYCSAEQSFCFYDYDDGQLPPVNGDNSTNVPTEEIFITIEPEASPIEDSTEPPVPEPVEDPTPAPVTAFTDPPETPSPTAKPTESPTPAPVQEEEEPESGGGGGSDGFDMNEIGSDGFDPNDLFGRRQLN